MRAIEAFENPLLFGNPGGVYVFSNEIYRVLRQRYPPQYNAATVLSVTLLVITFIMVFIQWRLLGNKDFTTISGKGFRPRRMRLPNPLRWTIFGLFVLYFLLAVVIPVGNMVASSFFQVFGLYQPEHFTFDNWARLFREERVMLGFRNTILYSAAAAVGVVALGGIIAYIRIRTRHWLGGVLELVAWVPWTLPGLVLGLALLWSWLLFPRPFNLYGTAAIIILGFIVRGLPLGTRTMQSAIMQLSRDLEECSRVHGGSWLKTMRSIVLPLIRVGAAMTFVIVFALAARDLTIPLLLYSRGTETLTITLLNYYEVGQLNVTAAIAVVQLLLVVGLLAIERVTRPRVED